MISQFPKVNEPIFYVTPDPSRAIGLEKLLPNYHLVCLDDSPLTESLRKNHVRLFSLEKVTGEKNLLLRNTGKILAHPLVQEYIHEKAGRQRPNILFFKPSKSIEVICRKKGYRLLGNLAELNHRFEDKIGFYRLCQSWHLPVPPGEICLLQNSRYQNLARLFGKRLVVQFGHGWAGKTTFFINNEKDFISLQSRFPKRTVRVTKMIEGRTFLNNACVTRGKVFVSPPAVQITDPDGLKQNPGVTCGRQWPAYLLPKRAEQIETVSRFIGEQMAKEGYRGYFGLDFIVEEDTGRIFLSENNARLTASVSLYTQMELKGGKVPFLFYHLQEFLGKLYLAKETLGKDELVGAELILRNTAAGSVRIDREMTPGVYTLAKSHLAQIREGYRFEDIKTDGELLVLAAGRGRFISSENEIAKLQTFSQVVDGKGQIANWVSKALLQIKAKLNLEEDDHS